MVFQDKLDQLDQKYERLLDARQVARNEVANGNNELIETLVGVVLGVGRSIFTKLFNLQ